MTPTQRKAAEQALEAYSLRDYDMGKYMEALRAALAEQPAEPVAWQGVYDPTDLYWRKPPQTDVRPLYTAPQPAIPPGYKLAPVEPTPEMMRAAFLALESEGLPTTRWMRDTYRAMLNAAPEAPKPAKQPLTQQEVVDGFCKTPHQVQYVAMFDAGVRFAERAHGITKE